MADATYQPKTYRSSGGNEIVVASSGDIKVESGGEIAVQSGGWLDIESGGQLQISGTAAISSGVQAAGWKIFSEAATTAAALTAYGVSQIAGTSTDGSRQYSMTLSSGVVKYIYCSVATSSYAASVTLTTGTWDGTNAAAVFSTSKQALAVFQATSTSCYIISYTPYVTFSSGTTG